MKKIIYILAIFFILSIISGVLFAKTETLYDKAIHYYNSGKYREAVEIFKDYIQTKPEAPAYYRIGYALYELGKYDEAQYYFQQAYLIDPSFSPNIVASMQKEEMISQPTFEQVPTMQVTQIPTEPEMQPETSPSTVPELQPQMQTEQQEEVTTPEKEFPPEEIRVVTPRRIQPPEGFPEFPEPTERMPSEIPRIAPGLTADLGMIMTVIQIVSIILYLFFCFCVFLIAKKLEVPAPWLAFIPIINIWTIVSCAGKPWWWILLLLIPIINIVIGIVIWMSITKNMGKNKWLGLLMLVPIVNYIFLAILAFSKTKGIVTAEGIPTA